MTFKVNIAAGSEELPYQCISIIREIEKEGHSQVAHDRISNFVLNIIDLDSPKAYRRKNEEEMVVSIACIREPGADMKSKCYASLVKSISNILFCLAGSDDDLIKGFGITPEVGFIEFPFDPERMFRYMYPVISSHFVLRNRIFPDLNLQENQLIPEVDDIIVYARQLKALGVLPAPFPLIRFLDKDLIDHLFRLYQIKGLSYGNLSIRNFHYMMKGTTYWMTARGVDKSKLKGIGKDILLVKGYDKELNEMHVSVPPGFNPRIRVSVDAIEHYLIYNEFPGVGAIVHVHAWIDGITCTDQTYPCGTRELAENVVDLLRKTENPERAEIGLKNHGITVTGPDIRNIFDRITGRLKINVPMFS
jgi:ribulose-5-phosphate 4-epimerase/fuculose-1-phosphate aldolase